MAFKYSCKSQCMINEKAIYIHATITDIILLHTRSPVSHAYTCIDYIESLAEIVESILNASYVYILDILVSTKVHHALNSEGNVCVMQQFRNPTVSSMKINGFLIHVTFIL